MSGFLKLFKTKKQNKDDDDEGKKQSRRYAHSNENHRDRDRRARASSSEDIAIKPTAAYHTATQPRHNKGSRSCVGRDEYERYRFAHDAPFKERNARSGKRSHRELDYNKEATSNRYNFYDPELLDSDETFDTHSDNGRTFHNMEAKLEKLLYRLRREEERKNSYKQKLMSERIIRQHVEAKFVEDIQKLTKLVETLKNEQKSYKSRIALLEGKLKDSRIQPLSDHFVASGSLFISPPSTSNDHSQTAMVGAREALYSESGSTLPVQNTFRCPMFSDDIDEVKNFRLNEISSVEIPRSDSKEASDSTGSERTKDSTFLVEPLPSLPDVQSRNNCTSSAAVHLCRSASDGCIRIARATKMTNL